MKTIEDKIKELNVGDTVVVYNWLCRNDYNKPDTTTIIKNGNKYLHTKNGYKFDTKGVGEYGRRLFPGNMYEFIYWEETKTLTKELITSLEKHIGDLTREELSQIEKIISKDSEYVLIHKSGLSNIMSNNIEENRSKYQTKNSNP